jgi:SAM-dependent methyltransferase
MGERQQRLVFGEDAELYDAARPSYPQRLIDDVVALVGTGVRVLDIGCGTGKAAVLLARQGLGGVGLEAHPAMAAVARRNLREYPSWRVDVSGFEEWTDSHPFDLLTAAQAWHWLDPTVRFRKAGQLLRPGGWLVRWWNRPDEADSPVDQAIDEVYLRMVPELPARGVGSRGRPHDDGPGEADFGPELQRAYRWAQTYTAGEWTALLRTQSDHRLLDPEMLEPLLAAVGSVIEDAGGTYTHRYVCWLYAAQRH